MESLMSRLLHQGPEPKHELDTNLSKLPEPKPGHQRETSLSKLPDDCISAILRFATPEDACIFSAVAKRFRSAAYSDTVWSKFLPQQCQQILSMAVTPAAFSSKRELYFHLCNSIVIDGGRKRFWLERSTAKIGYVLSARNLTIIGGNDQRFWRWVSRYDSRFEELASLLAVVPLEVRGRIDSRVLTVGSEYRVLFLLKFGEYAQGWDDGPIKFSVTTPDGEEMESEQLLTESQRERWRINNGGWLEVPAGEFTVSGREGNYIEFCMKEQGRYWKSGLLIDGVRIEPKP